MKTLSVREACQALSHLDRLLMQEDEVIITRRGKPIARLVRIQPRKSIPSHRDLRDSMLKMIEGSETLVSEDRDAR